MMMFFTKIGTIAGLVTALALPVQLPGLEVRSRDFAQSNGTYTNGTLSSPDRLELNSETTVKLFPKRERWFGSLELLSLVQSAARGMRALFPKAERLQIGDIAQRTGGFIDGHSSHQNGLDVDLAYFRTDGREFDPATATEFPIEYVQDGKLSSVFDLEKNLRFLQLLRSSGLVNRVFVDPVIKVKLCEYAAKIGEKAALKETLRKLRPWPHHGDHFHVRIECPKHSPSCVHQAPIAEGDGCAEAAADAHRLYPDDLNLIHTPLERAAEFEAERVGEEGPGC